MMIGLKSGFVEYGNDVPVGVLGISAGVNLQHPSYRVLARIDVPS